MRRKGFTLVELLAVIFVIGLLAAIVYPNVAEMVSRSKKNSYNVLIEEIENAASKWALKYASYIPDGETITIRLIDLKKEGLIDKDITNPLTKKKFPDDMIIKIISKDGKLKYEVDVDSGTEEDDMDLNNPSIILVGLPYEKVEINTIYNDKGAVATDSKGNKIDSSKIVKKIIKDKVEVSKVDTSDFYKYEIEYSVTDPYNGKKAKVKRTVAVKDTIPPVLKIPPHTTISSADLSFSVMEGVSATDNSLKKPTITTEGNITLGIPGDYIIKYTATDGSGNSRTKKRTITISDDACVKIKIDGTVESGQYTKKDVILTAYLQNGHAPSNDVKYRWQKEVSGNWVDIEGATERSYKVTGTNVNGRYRLIASYGTCTVTSNIYNVIIDRTPPSISAILKKKLNSTDLTDSSNIDSLSSYTNNTWYNGYVVLRGVCSDSQSGCSVSYKVTGASSNTDGFVNKTTRNINAAGISTVTYKATDGVGNTATAVYTVKLDRTPPSISAILKKKLNSTDLTDSSNIASLSGYTNNTWYNGYVVLRGNCSDSQSGCSVSYKVTGASSNTDGFVNKTTRNINAAGISTVTYKATDGAGNTATAEYTVKLDRTAPTCKSSGGSDSWTNGSRTLTGTCSDAGGSDCKGNVSKNIDYETNSSISPGTVYDNAGNSTVCPNQTVRIDRKKPTLTYKLVDDTTGNNYTPGTWSTHGIYRYLYPNDTGGSGVREVQFNDNNGGWYNEPNLDKYWLGEMNRTSKYRVIDNAGNVSDEISLHYMIDWTAPACPSISSTLPAEVWTNKDITFTFGFSGDTTSYTWYTRTRGASGWQDWINWGNNNPSVKNKTISGEGLRKVGVRVYDVAGNSQLCGTDPTYKIDKTAPYTPYLDVNATAVLNGTTVYINRFGDCGNECFAEAPGRKNSITLQQNNDYCFTRLSCNVGSNSKSTGKCVLTKKYACGGQKWSVGDDTTNAVDVSGVKSVTRTSARDYNCLNERNQGDYSVYIYQAVDNAGNTSAQLKVSVLNYHLYPSTILDKYYQFNNYEWGLKSGMSRPERQDSSCFS